MAENLKALAAVIRDETADAQNTATRVGTLLMLLAERAETAPEVGPGGQGVPVLTIDALNNYATDKATIAEAKKQPGIALQVVTDSAGVVCGVLLQYSDNMRHVLTQQLYSHFTAPTGADQALGRTHAHNRVFCLERCISHSMPVDITNAIGTSVGEDYLKTALGLEPGAYHLYQQGGNYYEPGYWTPWRALEEERIGILAVLQEASGGDLSGLLAQLAQKADKSEVEKISAAQTEQGKTLGTLVTQHQGVEKAVRLLQAGKAEQSTVDKLTAEVLAYGLTVDAVEAANKQNAQAIERLQTSKADAATVTDLEKRVAQLETQMADAARLLANLRERIGLTEGQLTLSGTASSTASVYNYY